MMSKIELGNQVRLATMDKLVFVVVEENTDGSFEIETQISEAQILRYGNIPKEMLRKFNG